MKFSCTVSPLDIPRMELLHKSGFDGYELHFALLAGMTDEQVTALRDTSDRLGIACVSSNGMFPGDMALLEGPESYPKIRDYLNVCFARAAFIGVPIVVLGSGGARRIPDGMDKPEAVRRFIAILRDVILPVAESYNITVAIEELNAAECNFINSCREAMEIINSVESRYLKLLVDYYHATLANDTYEEIISYGDKIAHVHFASTANRRLFPSEIDIPDLTNLFRALNAAGYDRAISVEAIPSGDFSECAANALASMKKAYALSKENL